MIHPRSVAPALLLAALLLPSAASAQEPVTCTFRGPAERLAERASPLDSVLVTLGEETAKVCYGRPSSRGRTMLGNPAYVPFDRPWRMGANEPTTFHLPFSAEIAGVDVDPGSYSLWVVPGPAQWEVHVSRAVDRWGIPIDDEVRSQDVGTAVIPVERLDRHVETLSLYFEPRGHGSGQLVLEWEGSRIRIPVRRPAP